MKHLYFLTFLFISAIGFAQIPAGYYSSATGTGYTLKTQLHNIIDDHNDQGYDAMDAFIATYDLDNYYETGSNTILDVYSENPTGNDPYNFTPVTSECGEYDSEGDCYNKEHVIPQSVFSSNAPMRGDAHQLLPTDGRVNGFRSNYPFGRVNDSQLVSQSGISNPTMNGSKLGNNLNSGYSAGYTGVVFEPIDEFKGDIARIYFYFATRYEDLISGWSAYEMFDGSTDKAIADPFLNILLTWHQNDPVSQKEIDRNNYIHYNHQGNRNPFIDHPEWVAAIWNASPDTQAPTTPTSLVASNPSSSTIDLNWTASSDDVGVSSYDVYVDAVFYINTNSNSPSFTVTGLSPETTYCFSVLAKDATGNMSPLSNTSCETTLESSAGSIELFISEYLEGSSNNKALEIANFTGNTVSLNSYSLKLSSNGNAGWTTTYAFPSNTDLSSGDVFVVANGGLTVCTSVVDNSNNGITGFNGNDAIGLFKNDVLIDIVGTLGDATIFAENTTLVRKPEVTGPSTTFDSNEWNSFASNTCDNLGIHTQTLSVDNYAVNEVKLYPNPVTGNILNVSLNKTFNYTVFNILGKQVLKGQSSNQKINVQSLSRGMYIIKLNVEGQEITKKLIRE